MILPQPQALSLTPLKYAKAPLRAKKRSADTHAHTYPYCRSVTPFSNNVVSLKAVSFWSVVRAQLPTGVRHHVHYENVRGSSSSVSGASQHKSATVQGSLHTSAVHKTKPCSCACAQTIYPESCLLAATMIPFNASGGESASGGKRAAGGFRALQAPRSGWQPAPQYAGVMPQ